MSIEVDSLKIHEAGKPSRANWEAVLENFQPDGSEAAQSMWDYAKSELDKKIPDGKFVHRSYLGRSPWLTLIREGVNYPYPYTKKHLLFTRSFDPYPDPRTRAWEEVKLYAALEVPAVFNMADFKEPNVIKDVVYHNGHVDLDYRSGQWRVTEAIQTFRTETVEDIDYTQAPRHSLYATGYEEVEVPYTKYVSRPARPDEMLEFSRFGINPEDAVKMTPLELFNTAKDNIMPNLEDFLDLLNTRNSTRVVKTRIGSKSLTAEKTFGQIYEAHLNESNVYTCKLEGGDYEILATDRRAISLRTIYRPQLPIPK